MKEILLNLSIIYLNIYIFNENCTICGIILSFYSILQSIFFIFIALAFYLLFYLFKIFISKIKLICTLIQFNFMNSLILSNPSKSICNPLEITSTIKQNMHIFLKKIYAQLWFSTYYITIYLVLIVEQNAYCIITSLLHWLNIIVYICIKSYLYKK